MKSAENGDGSTGHGVMQSKSKTGPSLPRKSGAEKKKITKADISIPINFRHVGHIGWDTSGIDISIPDYEEEPRDPPRVPKKKAPVQASILKGNFIAKNVEMSFVKGYIPPQPSSPPIPPVISPRHPSMGHSALPLPSRPPPPPPPLPTYPPSIEPHISGRNALLEDIQKGATLRKSSYKERKKDAKLLHYIRKGIRLKKVSQPDPPKEEFETGDMNPLHTEQENGKEEHVHPAVPTEILARGPEAVEAFKKALSEGKTRVRRVPIMLIGQERAGKTSLLKSLKGELFDPDEESTKGIAIDPSLCKVTNEIWKAGQTSGEDVTDAMLFDWHVAMVTVKNLRGSAHLETPEGGEEKDVGSLKKDSRHDVDTGEKTSSEKRSSPSRDAEDGNCVSPEWPAVPSDERDGPEVQSQTATAATESETSINSNTEVPEEIAALIETLMEKAELEDDNDIYSTLWDFAGQSVFYTTHSLFLTHRAIYILVNDLSKSQNQAADLLVKQGLFQKHQDANFARTNLDFLHFWMTSIASLGSDSENIIANEINEEYSGSLPPVIFVCTHADKPFGGASPRALAREIFGSLRQKPYKSHLVGDFFVVDNTQSGSGEEDPEVPRLREKILRLCRELPQFQNDIPVKWLRFEKALSAASQEGFNSLKLAEARKIALDVCGITDEKELRAVLDFLHDQRIVVHFDDSAELDDLVVLDPQWLIDILKEVITVKPFESEENAFEQHWRELENSGILKRDLLEHVWSHLLNQRNTIEALVSIMEKFNLICRWPALSASTEEYLVPHMLKSLQVSTKLTELLSSSVVPSLFIRFPRVQDPQNVFPHLMVCLIHEWTKEQPCFQRPKLFRNFVRLFLKPSGGSSLVLFCHSTVIEVALCSPTSPPGCFVETTCRRVVRVLRQVLEHIHLECRWLKAVSYELCFRCPVCCGDTQQAPSCGAHHVMDCNKEECVHFHSEKEMRESRQPIRCEKSEVAMDTAVPLQIFSPWLEGYGERKDNRKQEKTLSLPEDIISTLQSTDKVTIVQRATEFLQLDKAALTEPSADTRQKVRGLANQMKRCNRADVVQHLRTLVPSGTTGPLLDELLPVHNMPPKERKELTVFLSGGEEWELVASNLGFSNSSIRYFGKQFRNPADEMLAELTSNCTVGDLYDVLVKSDMAAVADIL